MGNTFGIAASVNIAGRHVIRIMLGKGVHAKFVRLHVNMNGTDACAHGAELVEIRSMLGKGASVLSVRRQGNILGTSVDVHYAGPSEIRAMNG